MNFILLSGGSGKRLWPLSNDVRIQTILKVLKDEKGEYESMVQRVYRQIRTAAPEAEVTIATGKKQVSSILNHLGDKVSVCVEPARRDTFPAIALAAAYLACEKKVDESEAVAVCPVDPYVDTEYFAAIAALADAAKEGEGNLYLLGVRPTYPSENMATSCPLRPARSCGWDRSRKNRPKRWRKNIFPRALCGTAACLPSNWGIC